jgi:polyhydroxyalkanoate synthase subunit PhaC
VIETLTKQGVEVYFIDWLPPTRADSWRGFDAYINGDLANAVQAVQIREEVEEVSLLGYCFGGLLTTIYTALYPEAVKNLINFTLPLDMSVKELPMQALMDKVRPETIDLITTIYGNCPARFIKAGFDGMSPVHHALDKYVGLYRNKEREGYTEMFELFEQWMNSDVPLAGQIFREMTQEVFRKNLVVKGQFQVGGQRVNLQDITCPVLNVIGEHDDIVHPKSSLPLVDLVGSSDAQNLVFPTGHIGAAVSTAAQKKLWPQVGGWLRERDGEWMH